LSEHTSFNDKIVVWGEPKKRWLINEYNVDPSRILVTGSPRHDDYFSSRLKNKNNHEKTLLLAPNPINEINGQSGTNLKLQFNQTIKKTLEIIKKFDNVKVIVKLHPIQLQHNEEIKLLIKNLDSSIPIYLWTSVIDTINNVDAVLVLTPEIHATPTMLLESMILGKPTMNVFFDKTIPEYDHIKNNAVFTVTNNDDLESNLKKFLFDNNFQNSLQKNADDFVNEFMANPGIASKKLASILKSY
jgi:UDP-N-acetylglucosamine 2-epimerase